MQSSSDKRKLYGVCKDMKFEQEFRNAIKNAIGTTYRTLNDLADASGVNQSSLSLFISGKRKGLQLESVARLVDALGLKLTSSHEEAKEVCFVNAKLAPIAEGQEPPQAEDYMAVPLVAEVGAGAGYIQQGELLSWFLVYKHQDAVRYRSNLVAVQIGKHSTSMVPILKPNDIVLVDLDDKNTSKPGRIMLVQDPMDGSGMIKRVAVEQRDKDFRITYYSDNAAENPPAIYSFREDFNSDWNKVVAGHVVWAWSDVSGK